MTALTAFAAVGAALAAVLFALWTYRKREVRVAGSDFLTALRALVLALTVLLILNPRIPGWGAAGSRAGEWLLLDASLSMAATSLEGPSQASSAWQEALSLSEVRAAGRTVLFSSSARPLAGPVEDALPTGSASRLADAVRIAAEGGAPAVRIVSDFRVTDLTEALALVDVSGMTAALQPVGSVVVNVGIAEVGFPDYLAAGDTASADIAIFASGAGEGDSVRVEVRDEGRLVGAAVLSAPGPGALRRVRIPLPSPAGDLELHRYQVTAGLDGDAFPEDDERIAYVRTDRREGGLVLVSRAPDFEPRFLLPALAEITGLEPEGFLDVSGGRFLRMSAPDGTTLPPADSAAVRRRVGAADLVVLHGVSDADAWSRAVVAAASRLILIPGSAEGAGLVDLSTGRAVGGEWYVDGTLPPSPVTAELTGLDPEGLPPLGPMLPIAGTTGWPAALYANRSAGGPREAVIAVSAAGDRRRVVVLAGGMWRWAFRGGAALAAYRRVWSAVAGWAIAGQVTATAADVGPETRVVPRDQPVAWRATGHEGGRLRFSVQSGDSLVMDTVLSIGQTGQGRSAPLPPGEYQYRVVVEGEAVPVGQGRFDVERFVPELRWPIADPETVVRTAGVGGSIRVAGRRLRTSALPYLLLMAALSVEWFVRRERGLR